MLELVQPSWLFALAGIAVPVIIHFWNQPPGRILKVGSIALVPGEAKEYKRNLQLSDLLLLLLRCLLIAALAIALATPLWKKPYNASRQKGWILIGKKNFLQTYSHFKPQVDSLYKAGFEFHYFNEGFEKEKLEDAAGRKEDSAAQYLSYWKLAEALDAILPSALPVYIFSDNYLKHFTGKRPVLSRRLTWITYTPSVIHTKDSVVKDTAALHISIFTDKYGNDACYLKAAIDAIKSFSKKNISLTLSNDDKQMAPGQDWLFWLSDRPFNKDTNAKNIFYYSPGREKDISSAINIDDIQPPLLLYKSVAPDDSLRAGRENIWTDGFGNPILSRVSGDNSNYYTFFTHFDPAWNELVWNDNFPVIIYNLLIRQPANQPVIEDSRLIDPKQLMPAYQSIAGAKDMSDSFETKDLSGLSWLLLLILFFAERFVSSYNHKLKTNG